MSDTAKVGYGDEYSSTRRTAVSNAFCRMECTPVDGGAELRIFGRAGQHVVDAEIDEGGAVVLHLRNHPIPRKGQQVRVASGRVVTVAEIRWDARGHLQILDEDLHTWEPWR